MTLAALPLPLARRIRRQVMDGLLAERLEADRRLMCSGAGGIYRRNPGGSEFFKTPESRERMRRAFEVHERPMVQKYMDAQDALLVTEKTKDGRARHHLVIWKHNGINEIFHVFRRTANVWEHDGNRDLRANSAIRVILRRAAKSSEFRMVRRTGGEYTATHATGRSVVKCIEKCLEA